VTRAGKKAGKQSRVSYILLETEIEAEMVILNKKKVPNLRIWQRKNPKTQVQVRRLADLG
jgi:hypothetical protein